MLGSTGKLSPAHQVLQIPLSLSDWGSQMQVKIGTLSNVFIQLYWWTLSLRTSAFSNLMLHHQNVQHFNTFLTCAHFNSLHRGLNAICLLRGLLLFLTHVFFFFKSSVLEQCGICVCSLLQLSKREEGRLRSSVLVENLPSVTAVKPSWEPSVQWDPIITVLAARCAGENRGCSKE